MELDYMKKTIEAFKVLINSARVYDDDEARKAILVLSKEFLERVSIENIKNYEKEIPGDDGEEKDNYYFKVKEENIRTRSQITNMLKEFVDDLSRLNFDWLQD